MEQIALLGSTASGKTKLSIELAKVTNSIILSLDSLSIYKEIDIVSAKPTLKEREGIKHFGISVISPNDSFDVKKFFEIYLESKEYAQKFNKNLIIVGGTSFYLKSMIEGLSKRIKISKQNQERVEKKLLDIDKAYSMIKKYDFEYAKKIAKNDKYRIEKWLEIYFESGEILGEYFKKNKGEPIIKDIKIYQIDIDRELLRERIKLRTKKMIENGLIEEVKYLKKRYGTEINPMKSIGIKETLEYLDDKFDIEKLAELISIHTAQLAKRQRTFNKTQFRNVELLSKDKIFDKALEYLN